MISHEVTQRNIWPYMIVLGLIVMAFLLGWLASGALQTTGLQVNDNNASPAENVPAAPMFYFKERGTPGLAPAAVGYNMGADPAKPVLYFKERGNLGLAPAAVESNMGTDPIEPVLYFKERGNVDLALTAVESNMGADSTETLLYFKERGTPGLAPTTSESK